MARSERDVETETITKGGNVLVKIGSHKMTMPAATVIAAVLAALGTAYQVVKNDRADVLDRIAALEKADQAQCQKQEMQQLVLVEIRTQLARIDARVAEVQVTLMRGGGR